jgi:hypothetical protein
MACASVAVAEAPGWRARAAPARHVAGIRGRPLGQEVGDRGDFPTVAAPTGDRDVHSYAGGVPRTAREEKAGRF